jgi:APA family basic amino acid/polyamine antiporter
VGLVLSDMIGSGVFLSTGFMAQDMGPGVLLLCWLVGALLALFGARAYAEVAQRVPRSGGEYRYLSELWHPALGYLAGWASLLLGFSAPLAVDAVAAGSFARTVGSPISAETFGAIMLVLLTGLHTLGWRSSRWTQNGLAALKVVLMAGFLGVGLIAGEHHWPTWTPPHASVGFPLAAFASSLFYVGFAFSGWNAAIYAAEEFEQPTRDVPRAMLIGCAGVGLLYMLVNWVFVANLGPAQASVVFGYDTDRVTLGHVILRNLVGDGGSKVMSVVILLLLLSAMSAMIFTGPRVYASMARDGFLPKALASKDERPPPLSMWIQSALALVLIYTHSLQEVLQNVGALLTLFAALTAGSLLWVRFARPDLPRPSLGGMLAAFIYVAASAWMFYFGFFGPRASPRLLIWVGGVAAFALIAYAWTRRRQLA